MKKCYPTLLAVITLFIFAPAYAQEVFLGTFDRYLEPAQLVFTLSADASQFSEPIPKNNDNLWGYDNPEILLGKDGNVYGLNQNEAGGLFYKITKDGLFIVHQFDYATMGPIIEAEQGTFYKFSSGADGNYVDIQKIKSDGSGFQYYGFYKPSFVPGKLINSGGAIYGICTSGGTNQGSGYLFKFTPTDDLKNFKVLYNFTPATGRKPVGRLAEGTDGFLYGVTSTGGSNDAGVIYKISKDGTQYTKLYDFSFANGRYPSTGVVTDGTGWLYGTTTQGGTGRKGVLYKVKTDGSNYTVLYNFSATKNGPSGDLYYFNGNVYGYENGVAGTPSVPMNIFKISTTTNSYSVFFTFPANVTQTGGSDFFADPTPFVPNVFATTPANNSTVSHINTRFVFNPIKEASLYTLELSLTTDFTNPIGRAQSNKPEFIATDLKPNTKYYVRVKTNVWATFGPVTTFNTAPLVVNNNYISNPKDGATNVSAPTTKVTAGTVTGAKRYTIELSTSPDFTTKLVRTSTVDNQRTLVFDSLMYSTKYYGRFKTDISGYGKVTSFTTKAEAFAQIAEPANGGTEVDPGVIHLAITTITQAKRYTIQLSNSPSFTLPIQVSSVEDNQTNFIVKDLKHSTQYYVRIKADINTTWSPTYSFFTNEAIAQKRLWGITPTGGAYGTGTVFSYSIDSATFTKHMDYQPTWENEGAVDGGESIQGSIIRGAKSVLYFHSATPGSSAYAGSIYQIKPDGTISWVAEVGLHEGNMTLASNDWIYTSVNSHITSGVIDRYEPTLNSWDRVYPFPGTGKGIDPGSELLELNDGYLYGRANHGGINDGGTLYRLHYDGSGFQVTHFFDNAVNGSLPSGDLVKGDDGYLYGTTAAGGTSGNGIIYKILPDGSAFTKIFEFDGTNGSRPYGGVIVKGNILYGATGAGGVNFSGVVYSIHTDGSSFVKLHEFTGTDGRLPVAKLTLDNTVLYGMTATGGTDNKGVIFKINTNGTGFATLFNFNSTTGFQPDGYLTLKEDTFTPTSALAARTALTVDVSPNPTTTDFSVMFHSTAEQPVQITITDLNGLTLQEYKGTSHEAVHIGETLNRGIYILKAKQGSHTTMHRLVKK
jgi:uncharacterized repeat protein (TIGR03803 family)